MVVFLRLCVACLSLSFLKIFPIDECEGGFFFNSTHSLRFFFCIVAVATGTLICKLQYMLALFFEKNIKLLLRFAQNGLVMCLKFCALLMTSLYVGLASGNLFLYLFSFFFCNFLFRYFASPR